MPDKKLTDNEIVKALKMLLDKTRAYECKNVSINKNLITNTLDLINRLQEKAEGLQLEIADTKRDLQIVLDNSISAKLPHCVLCGKGAILTKSLKEYDELLSDISAEAVTEFAERLISIGEKRAIKCDESPCAYVTLDDIRTLLKESEDKK